MVFAILKSRWHHILICNWYASPECGWSKAMCNTLLYRTGPVSGTRSRLLAFRDQGLVSINDEADGLFSLTLSPFCVYLSLHIFIYKLITKSKDLRVWNVSGIHFRVWWEFEGKADMTVRFSDLLIVVRWVLTCLCGYALLIAGEVGDTCCLSIY